MSRKKVRDLLLVFWGGLFLLSFEPVFLWLLVGSLVLFSSTEHKKENDSDNYFDRMKKDAKKYELRVPSQKQLRSLLKDVYERQEKSFREYPHLKAEYQQITDELWSSLSQKKKIEDWSYLITSVLESWPGQSAKSKPSNLGDKLAEVTELTRQWNEAKNEALGGQHV